MPGHDCNIAEIGAILCAQNPAGVLPRWFLRLGVMEATSLPENRPVHEERGLSGQRRGG